eukprot:5443025-Prymnesium_polylepis.3
MKRKNCGAREGGRLELKCVRNPKPRARRGSRPAIHSPRPTVRCHPRAPQINAPGKHGQCVLERCGQGQGGGGEESGGGEAQEITGLGGWPQAR